MDTKAEERFRLAQQALDRLAKLGRPRIQIIDRGHGNYSFQLTYVKDKCDKCDS